MAALASLLDELADRHSHDPAIVEHSGNRSYTELRNGAMAAAKALQSHGVVPGDRVGFLSEAGPANVFGILGAMAMGAIATPLNLRWPAERINHGLDHVDCRVVVADERHTAQIEGDRNVIRINSILGRADDGWPALADDHAPAIMVFTSGSTGMAKAAVHTFESIFANACASNQNIRLYAGHRWLLSLPLYHVSGLGIMFRCLASGAAMAIPHPEEALRNSITTLGATHVSFVPTQVLRMLDQPSDRRVLKQLDAILLGGSAIPPTLLHAAAEIGLPIYTTYGLTEMGSQVTSTRTDATVHEWFTSGRPLAPDTIGLRDDGEIMVTGPPLFAGYWRDGAIESERDENGWYATGDIGKFDKEGNLIVTGRKDNMFISGGENIHPEMIERALCRIVGIAEAVAVPKSDEVYGARPVAYVRLDEGTDFNDEQILDVVRASLPSYAIPTRVYPWPEDAPEGMKVDRQFFKTRANEED